ncbi:MAG: tRNA uridine(34) 5-carboxymethylaminomethyl modification radical SAM/GNAT enzyme Elp3 [Candidatus Diapherotrites archaeon]
MVFLQKEELFSREIIGAIEKKKVRDKRELNRLKISLCKKFGFREIPRNSVVLSFSKSPSRSLLSFLSIKPVRTLSGVAVVAAMVKPHKCPGKCIYCPNGIEEEMPKSYTGLEPASLRALMNGFDPFLQVKSRLGQLEQIGHGTDKIELIVMGGTFPCTPVSYQKKFVKGCLDAITEKKTRSLESSIAAAEKSSRRVIGITFETRPDFCGEKEISRFLSFGGTRVELGVQCPDDSVYKKVHRGHSVKDVVNATQLLKDSAFKVCYHLMPGLSGKGIEAELELFGKVFSSLDFRPDMLKLYPCLVVKGTRLHRQWLNGKFSPFSNDDAAEFISEFKRFVPKWVRVMRVQRDIPAIAIEAGVKKGNLRQLVEEKLKGKGIECNCIRCREAGLSEYLGKKKPLLGKARLFKEFYSASNGLEAFISADDRKANALFGFCRLRFPFKPFRKELGSSTALVRELHVFSHSLPLGALPLGTDFQHRGLGKKLMDEAEKTALEFGFKKIAVISGIGAREYYRKFLGYARKGAFMCKTL